MSPTVAQNIRSLPENSTTKDAAEFLREIARIRNLSDNATPKVMEDFIAALKLVSSEPESLICPVKEGTFYSNGRDHDNFVYRSIAHLLSPTIKKLNFSDEQLNAIQQIALNGAANTLNFNAVIEKGFSGESQISKIGRDLALLAVTTAALLKKPGLEDLGSFSDQ